MPLSPTLKQYLDEHHVMYDTTRHRRTVSSSRTAQAAHVRGDTLVKSVILKDDAGRFVLAAMPATHRLDIGKLDRQLHRSLGLATETELAELFRDCDLGAIPPVGSAYGVETVMDDSLTEPADVYFEAGDHEELVHMSSEQFRLLMSGVQHFPLSHHV
jgi:Ala-tRNA(Pro) deacylase